jgi:hypothetical protein
MFSKNFISIYFLTFVIFFFLNYSFVEIFDEDLIIISCFFFIFFLLKNILTNIFIKEIYSGILIVKEQFISILNLKKKFILDNFINYSEFNIFIINSTFYFFFYLSKFFNFVSVEKIIEVKKLWNNFFLYYLSINNTIEVLYIKTKSVDILRNLNIKN